MRRRDRCAECRGGQALALLVVEPEAPVETLEEEAWRKLQSLAQKRKREEEAELTAAGIAAALTAAAAADDT